MTIHKKIDKKNRKPSNPALTILLIWLFLLNIVKHTPIIVLAKKMNELNIKNIIIIASLCSNIALS